VVAFPPPEAKLKRGIILLVVAFLLAAPVARARELHWSDFSVKARLDAEGTLQVIETQTIVFTGDWNGGYRTFRLGPGQTLAFKSIRRIDSATGKEVFLTKGDLQTVDHFEWEGSWKIQWRSRRPSDPPFEGTALTYRLEYAIAGVLKGDGTADTLDHDFAFPDRESRIEHFTLDLELDPIWQAPAGFPTHLERSGLPPGTGVVVRAALTHHGAGRPMVVHIMSSRTWNIVLGSLFVFVLLLLFRFRQWEAASGRYAPLVPLSEIDPAWLKANLLSWKAEEAGAAWDDQVDAPEVAAFLARMVVEGKFASHFESEKSVLTSVLHLAPDKTLHLTLKAPRTEFTGYAKELIEKIFFDGNTTDMASIREHYERKGFDPAAILRGPLLAKVAQGLGPKRATPKWELLPPLLLALAAVAFGASVGKIPQNVPFLWGCVFGVIIASLLALAVASRLSKGWRSHYGSALDSRLPLFVIPPAIVLALPVYLGWSSYRLPAGISLYPPTAIANAIGCLGLAACIGIFLRIRSTDSPALVDRRRKLASARRFFEAELEKPAPALKDDWYPYIIAFGLDHHANRWLHSFGKSGGGTGFGSEHSSSLSSSSSSASSSWTGGGGSFGGAGASAAWGVAAAGIATGVAASSSGSGGGGGSSSSSGGGGGGGW
jgi:uncharacterized membrane protein YgcG